MLKLALPKKPVRASTSALEDRALAYKKMQLRDQVYKNPGMYIGDIETVQEKHWIYHDKLKFTETVIDFNEGLLKLYDEVLVNASDHVMRMLYLIEQQALVAQEKAAATPECNESRQFLPVKQIKIDLTPTKITICNDGNGIPIEKSKTEKCWIPEVIFGVFLTGSNYDETQVRTWGGKHGYGAKLANLFSKEFVIETIDHERGMFYQQTWRNHMTERCEPIIKPSKGKPYTKISFTPDLERFGLTEIPPTLSQFMHRRAIDVAACSRGQITVWFNGVKSPVWSFDKYVNMYIGLARDTKRVNIPYNDRWLIVVCLSPNRKALQTSFVNNVFTDKGGKHVSHLVDQIARKAKPLLQTKKGPNITERYIKENLWIFVSAVINNPDFNSQTKREHTTKVSKFGGTVKLDEPIIKKIIGLGLRERVQQMARFATGNSTGKPKRKSTKVNGVTKLYDAPHAGSAKSGQCVLVLTEGDSAFSSAIASVEGLSHDQRKFIGAMPLRGKFINARTNSSAKLNANAEIQQLMKALNLHHGVDYSIPSNFKTLRYGKVRFLCDADHDGELIKGLLMNFFQFNWPKLIERDGFLEALVTPIVKVWKERANGDIYNEKAFYSLRDYESWQQELGKGKWEHMYYKGLGTSSSDETRNWMTGKRTIEYIKDTEQFEVLPGTSLNKTDYYMKLMYDRSLAKGWAEKKMSDERKSWLIQLTQAIADGTAANGVDTGMETYSHFAESRWGPASLASLDRVIPHAIDGLKPSQRKIIFVSFKRNLKKFTKVAQLAGAVSEESGYHHGEVSLQDTIVRLAAFYCGANNLPLMAPKGQFGTRLGGGSKNSIGFDGAQSRYIFTKLADTSKVLFNQHDMPLFNYLEDDNRSIEPDFYVPIIPLLLVNGVLGIGTGFQSFVPQFNPIHVIENVKRMIRGEECVTMTPWYAGFKGTIKRLTENTFSVFGAYRFVGEDTMIITEIPVGLSTSMSFKKYKELLERIVDYKNTKEKDKKVPFLVGKLIDYTETPSQYNPSWTLTFAAGQLDKLKEDLPLLHKELKLVSTIHTKNMFAYDATGKIKLYATAADIIREHYHTRLHFYKLRKQRMIDELLFNLNRISSKARFIELILSGDIAIMRGKRPLKKVQWVEQLEATDPAFPKQAKGFISSLAGEKATYNYLTSMQIHSLTEETLAELRKEKDAASLALASLQKIATAEMWLTDLEQLEAEYTKFLIGWRKITLHDTDGTLIPSGKLAPPKVRTRPTKPVRFTKRNIKLAM